MVKEVGGYPQVVIRVSVDDKRLIKKFGGNYADIWRLGFEKFLEITPQKMQEKAQYHYEMYKKCNDIVTTCNDIVTTKKSILDEQCLEFNKTRSAENPTKEDLNWIDGRISKHGLNTTRGDFLARCKKLKDLEGVK